jgi:hypothetical protein
MQSIRGWLLVAVAGMGFWISWEVRSFASSWGFLAISVLALILGILHIQRR